MDFFHGRKQPSCIFASIVSMSAIGLLIGGANSFPNLMMFVMPGTGLYLALNSPNSNREEEPPIQTSPIQLENTTIRTIIYIIIIIRHVLTK